MFGLFKDLEEELEKLQVLEFQVVPLIGEYLKDCNTPEQVQARLNLLMACTRALDKTIGNGEKTYFIDNPVTGGKEMTLKRVKGKIIFVR